MSDIFVGSAQASHLHIASIFAIGFAATAIGVASTRYPHAALLALLLAIPFNFAQSIASTTIDLPKAILVAILVTAILRGRLCTLFPQSTVLQIIAFLGVSLAVLDAAGASDASDRGVCFRESLKALQYVLTLIVAAYLARLKPSDSESSYLPLLAIAAASVSFAALADERNTGHSVVAIGTSLVTRVAGPLEGPNQLSGYLQLFLPLLVVGFLNDTGRIRRVISGLSFTIATMTMVLTFSRSGMASTALSTAIAVAFGVRERSAAVKSIASFVFVAIGGGLALAFRHYGHRGSDDREQLTGLATRGELWHAALVLWQRRPIFGIGAGNYELELPSTGLLGVRTHANNYYLQTLAEGGVVSLAIVVTILAAAVVSLAQRAPLSWFAAGTLAATIGIAAHQGFDDLFFFPKVGATWYALLGIAFAFDPARQTVTRRQAMTIENHALDDR